MALSKISSIGGEISEFQRLKTLLPKELRGWVTVKEMPEVNPPLIKCKKVSRVRVEIQLDLIRWEQMSMQERDLLFWHEVARIQNNTVRKDTWEIAVLAIGLGGAVVEIWAQNILLLSSALLLSGMVGYHLYQRNSGERSLREATAADKDVIALATRFGYTLPQAYISLGRALKALIAQTPKQRLRAKYEARLQVLKVGAVKAKKVKNVPGLT